MPAGKAILKYQATISKHIANLTKANAFTLVKYLSEYTALTIDYGLLSYATNALRYIDVLIEDLHLKKGTAAFDEGLKYRQLSHLYHLVVHLRQHPAHYGQYATQWGLANYMTVSYSPADHPGPCTRLDAVLRLVISVLAAPVDLGDGAWLKDALEEKFHKPIDAALASKTPHNRYVMTVVLRIIRSDSTSSFSKTERALWHLAMSMALFQGQNKEDLARPTNTGFTPLNAVLSRAKEECLAAGKGELAATAFHTLQPLSSELRAAGLCSKEARSWDWSAVNAWGWRQTRVPSLLRFMAGDSPTLLTATSFRAEEEGVGELPDGVYLDLIESPGQLAQLAMIFVAHGRVEAVTRPLVNVSRQSEENPAVTRPASRPATRARPSALARGVRRSTRLAAQADVDGGQRDATDGISEEHWVGLPPGPTDPHPATVDRELLRELAKARERGGSQYAYTAILTRFHDLTAAVGKTFDRLEHGELTSKEAIAETEGHNQTAKALVKDWQTQWLGQWVQPITALPWVSKTTVDKLAALGVAQPLLAACVLADPACGPDSSMYARLGLTKEHRSACDSRVQFTKEKPTAVQFMRVSPSSSLRNLPWELMPCWQGAFIKDSSGVYYYRSPIATARVHPAYVALEPRTHSTPDAFNPGLAMINVDGTTPQSHKALKAPLAKLKGQSAPGEGWRVVQGEAESAQALGAKGERGEELLRGREFYLYSGHNWGVQVLKPASLIYSKANNHTTLADPKELGPVAAVMMGCGSAALPVGVLGQGRVDASTAYAMCGFTGFMGFAWNAAGSTVDCHTGEIIKDLVDMDPGALVDVRRLAIAQVRSRKTMVDADKAEGVAATRMRKTARAWLDSCLVYELRRIEEDEVPSGDSLLDRLQAEVDGILI
ncbi:Peptidase family C50 [Carpediemonas membranifera]|uniref:Peptidase family C50 n=1 Tax=Carpediemonas membranifera TaxID=201153 RepID=A0A8J6DXR4_9EUKA|nr:Peptidase family C50 [Carpediemonas membranifera]|eukprot:KAG9390834.1 Peptidase family C50 [Carpediemonas membranifera]